MVIWQTIIMKMVVWQIMKTLFFIIIFIYYYAYPELPRASLTGHLDKVPV